MKGLLRTGLTALCMTAPAFGATQNVETCACDVVSLLDRKEFRRAAQSFDDTMKKAVPPARLAAIWGELVGEAGAYQGIQGTRSQAAGPYRAVFVTCQFKKKRLDVKVVFDKERRIAGMFFVPAQETSYRAPAYAQSETFRETEVHLGRGEWSLPGTLAVPTGKGPFAAVILVHGSGAHDRDETIGPNKPFRDLAWGLASRQIVVLRYEKRTRQYADKIAAGVENFTVQHETIADVSEAVALLQRTASVNVDRVFVLGHSLGGMLIPRIARENSTVAGWVIMAANARPLEDLILEQALFQASLKGELSAGDNGRISEVKEQVAAIKRLPVNGPLRSQILGAPKSYWLDLKDYRPAKAAKDVARPMLIMQGESDCQVSRAKDFEEWRHELSGRRDVEFRVYPALNHLFMEVDGASTGLEYQQPGNVAETVVKDIADWIGKR